MPGKFKLVEEKSFLSVYSNGKVEVRLRRIQGDQGFVDIDVFTLKFGEPTYDVALTSDGYSVTTDIRFPMRSLRPKRIDKAIGLLQDAKAGIQDIEDLLRMLFPDTPIADRP